METHSCTTYLSVGFPIDMQKNAALLSVRSDCLPQEIGIYNKDEVEGAIQARFGVVPTWDRHHFVIGYNKDYDVDVNRMIRATLKDLMGKEEELKQLQREFGVSLTLQIVPYIVADADEPKQILSLDRDILEFLLKSNTTYDIDYYII